MVQGGNPQEKDDPDRVDKDIRVFSHLYTTKSKDPLKRRQPSREDTQGPERAREECLKTGTDDVERT